MSRRQRALDPVASREGAIAEFSGDAGRATGSRPVVPPEFAALASLVLDNEDVFDWADLPEYVAVLGTGPIGLELGQALHRLGVRVRILGRSGAISSLTDPEVQASAERILAGELPLELHGHSVRCHRRAHSQPGREGTRRIAGRFSRRRVRVR